jgi:CBS domain-containing protein
MVQEPSPDRRDQGADEREPILPEPEPGNQPEREPGNAMARPDAEKPPERREGIVSDPDFRRPAEFTQRAMPGGAAVPVREVMTRHVEVAHPDSTLEEAAEKMKLFDIGPLPVCDGGRLVGLITDRDIIVRSVAQGEDPSRDRVRDVMTPEVIYCFEDQLVEEAARLMQERQVDQLPVLNRDQRLVGIVSLGDLAGSGEEG